MVTSRAMATSAMRRVAPSHAGAHTLDFVHARNSHAINLDRPLRCSIRMEIFDFNSTAIPWLSTCPGGQCLRWDAIAGSLASPQYSQAQVDALFRDGQAPATNLCALPTNQQWCVDVIATGALPSLYRHRPHVAHAFADTFLQATCWVRLR